MMGFLRKNLILVAGFALVLGATVFFGLGALDHARDYRGAPVDRDVKPWMTTRYIAHTWNLPREVMSGLGFERTPDGPRPLRKIAAERGIPVEDLIVEVEAAIAAHLAKVGQ